MSVLQVHPSLRDRGASGTLPAASSGFLPARLGVALCGGTLLGLGSVCSIPEGRPAQEAKLRSEV